MMMWLMKRLVQNETGSLCLQTFQTLTGIYHPHFQVSCKYHGQLWDVREVIKMNVHLIPQNTLWSTTSLSANPKTASHESPFECLHRFPLHPAVSTQATAFEKLPLCCDVQQIVQGEWGLCFLAWQCPCHLPPKSRRPAPLCDTSVENVKGEQIPPSNLWGGWTLHPLAMTRGDWKSPLVVIFFLPPFSVYLSMSLCISLASWHDIFIHWLFSLCTLQASETPLQSIQMSMRISVSLLFLSCLRLIFYFPLSILASCFFWLLPHLYGRIPLPKL